MERTSEIRGDGNGRLDWRSQVRPLMVGLPDNVEVHS